MWYLAILSAMGVFALVLRPQLLRPLLSLHYN